MKNKKIIAAIVLSIAAVFSLVYGLTASPKGKGTAAPEPEAVQENTLSQPACSAASVKRNSAKTKFTSWDRNPFMLEPASVDVFEKLTLNGILWDEKSPMAVINDEIKKIGDKAGGNTIIGITQNKVILSDGVKDFELILSQ